MQKAKAFFLVCAGFFLLALSYHLGVRSATAQVGGTIGGAGPQSGGYPSAAILTGSALYIGAWDGAFIRRGPIALPKAGAVAGVGSFSTGADLRAVIVYEDGDMYYETDDALGSWEFPGNLKDAPTAGAPTTWGKVKADYRK